MIRMMIKCYIPQSLDQGKTIQLRWNFCPSWISAGIWKKCRILRASFSFLTDRLSYLLTNRLRQVAFPVSLSVKRLLTVTARLTITIGYLTDG